MAAISGAKEQIANDPTNDALKDTLAYRLLNCTLWHLRAKPPRPAEAAGVLAEVLGTTVNARVMATVAMHVSAEPLVSGGTETLPDGTVVVVTPDPAILGAVSTLVHGALALAAVRPVEFDDSDFIADLAAAHCDIGCTAPHGGIMPGMAFSAKCKSSDVGGGDPRGPPVCVSQFALNWLWLNI